MSFRWMMVTVILGSGGVLGCKADRETREVGRRDDEVRVHRQSGVSQVPASPDLWSLPEEPTRQLQQVLADHELYAGPPTGVPDPQTRKGLHAFQAQKGLPVGDKITDETARALGLDITEVRRVARPLPEPAMGGQGGASAAPGSSAGEYLGVGKPITAAREDDPQRPSGTAIGASDPRGLATFPTLDDIAAAQRELAARGLYDGKVTGELDDATKRALREFQTAQGIPPTGTLDRATGVALGL